jgi:hypothetical protein
MTGRDAVIDILHRYRRLEISSSDDAADEIVALFERSDRLKDRVRRRAWRRAWLLICGDEGDGSSRFLFGAAEKGWR